VVVAREDALRRERQSQDTITELQEQGRIIASTNSELVLQGRQLTASNTELVSQGRQLLDTNSQLGQTIISLIPGNGQPNLPPPLPRMGTPSSGTLTPARITRRRSPSSGAGRSSTRRHLNPSTPNSREHPATPSSQGSREQSVATPAGQRLPDNTRVEIIGGPELIGATGVIAHYDRGYWIALDAPFVASNGEVVVRKSRQSLREI